ncbi:MAG: DUF1552 domain-containing protein [Planctomycetaceae bacterium]
MRQRLCVCLSELSFVSSPTTPLPPEANPRVVFEQLFGEGGTAADRKAVLRRRVSLLDSVNDEFARLKKSLGPEDQQRIEEYQNAVRDVERRIQKAEQSAGDQLPDVERPVGVPASYRDHARLMFDLQKLALQGDMTRVITFQMARETSNRTYPEIGVNEPHHPLTHHGNDPEMIAKVAEINRFHVSLFSEFLQVLGRTPEAGGTLLDNVLYLYGSGMGNPNLHDHTNLPIVVAGGAAGSFRGGRHVTFQNSTPLANLHLTLLDRVGIPMEQFADSNGRFDDLFGPVSL